MVIIILLLISIFVHTCMIMANLEISEARNFHANVIEEIQASHYIDENEDGIPDVASKKIEEADKRGWKLQCQDMSVNDSTDWKVTLIYKISPLPLLNANEYDIVGYAR